MTERKNFRRWTSCALVVLVIIWGNSCLPGNESGALSDGFLAQLQKLLPFLGWMDGFIIRKLAHFSEFALYAFFLGLAARSYGLTGPACRFVPAALALFTACVDETIQIFSPGRVSALTDVWIDFAGACSGLLFLRLLLWILNIKKKRG